MPIINTITPGTIGVPGSYVFEGTYGAIPKGIASHNDVYVLGFGSKGPYNTPTFIQSNTDLLNTFGTTLSAAAIALFFLQKPGNGIWFTQVQPRATRSVTYTGVVTAGTVFSITFDGFTVSYTTVSGDTLTSVGTALATKVNSSIPSIASMTSDGSTLRTNATTVTPSSNVTLGTLGSVPAYPVLQDVIDTITVAFTGDLNQGFIVAPEFFQSFTNQTDRTALAQAMESLASDPRFNWMSIVDAGASVVIDNTTSGGAVNKALAEKALISSPKGHSIYSFPYVLDATGTSVPSSLVIAGIALNRFRQEGYRQPPAGTNYPINGITGVTFKVTDLIQQQLNPAGINCIRTLPGFGYVVYGSRTLSPSSFYIFATTRIIMNVLDRSLRDALRDVVFTSIDGQGATFARIKGTATQICESLRQAGALFGVTPEQAYRVVCDASNNPGINLDNGLVTVDVYVKPSPIAEVVVTRTFRTSLSTDLTSVEYQNNNLS